MLLQKRLVAVISVLTTKLNSKRPFLCLSRGRSIDLRSGEVR